MYRSETRRDLLTAPSRCPFRLASKILPSAFCRVAVGLLSPPSNRLTQTRAILIIGVAVQVFALLGAPDDARADCAAGDGNIATPGTCTTPQVLTATTGVVVSGATLTTGPNTTAYTVSSTNATVTNSGAVASQGPQAFLVKSSGGTLVNNGSINASQGPAILVNTGQSLNFVNTGSVIGGNGLALDYLQAGTPVGALSTLTQAAGTIQGDIILPGFNLAVLNVTGGVINGGIDGGSFTTGGNIRVGTVNVQSGTLVLENNVYASSGLTNNATLQISGIRTLIGSFVQSASGRLVMQVSPQSSSQLRIARLPFFGGGTASLAGTLALAYQPGSYQAHTYTLISADSRFTSVTGRFSNITGVVPTPGLTQTVTIGPSDVELTLSGAAQPADDTIFPAAATAVVLNGQRVNSILLDRLGARQNGITDGGEATSPGGPARVRLAQAGNVAALGEIASALPQALASQGAWFRGIGDFASVGGNAAAPGFSGASGGFLAGFDRPIATDLYLGLAAGYVHSDLSEHLAGSGQVDSGRVAVYGGGWLGPNLLTGTTGYAYDRISTTRSLSGAGTEAQAHNGHEFSIAGQWSLPTPVTGMAGTAVVTPKIGVQFLHLAEDGFMETGAAGFGLSSRGNDTDSFQPYLGVAASERFVAADGTEITITG